MSFFDIPSLEPETPPHQLKPNALLRCSMVYRIKQGETIYVNVSEPTDVRAALVYSVNKDSTATAQMKCTVVKPKGWSSWEQDPFLSLLVSEFVMNQGINSPTDGYPSRWLKATPRPRQGYHQSVVRNPCEHRDPMWDTKWGFTRLAGQVPPALSGPGLNSIFEVLATCQSVPGPFDLSHIAKAVDNGFWEFVQQQIALVHVDSLERPSSCTVCRFDTGPDYMGAVRGLLLPEDLPDPLSAPPLWEASREQVAKQLTAANIEHAFL